MSWVIDRRADDSFGAFGEYSIIVYVILTDRIKTENPVWLHHFCMVELAGFSGFETFGLDWIYSGRQNNMSFTIAFKKCRRLKWKKMHGNPNWLKA